VSLDPLVGRHEISTPEEMEAIGARMGRMLRPGDLVVLTGALGAGKTTLTRGIGEGLGVRGPVQSPTFVIARTHPSLVGGSSLVHVDAYRLGSALELDDLDIDVDRSVVIVEWGRGMVDGLRDIWWEVELEPVYAEPGGMATASASPAGSGSGSGSVALDADAPRVLTVSRRP
jgi:tRNA threonylcarbamoyl adenosine modification protein YjeE